jgi:hypothetical protein
MTCPAGWVSYLPIYDNSIQCLLLIKSHILNIQELKITGITMHISALIESTFFTLYPEHSATCLSNY